MQLHIKYLIYFKEHPMLIRKYLFTLLLSIHLFIFSSINIEANTTLTFTNMEGSMYSKLTERVLKTAYKRIDINFQVKRYPAKRALVISNSGEVDGELFRIANINKKWKNLVMVPTPIAYLKVVSYSKNKNIKISSWDSLKPYKIGIKRGIIHSDKGTKGMQRQIVESNTQLFTILKNDRVDVIVLAYFNALKELRNHLYPDIKLLKPALTNHPLHHYLHKKNKSIVAKLDKELQAMEKQGLIEKYRKEYIKELSL